MGTITWVSNLSGDWNTAADWSPEVVPVSGDFAIVSAGTAQLLSGVDPAAGVTLDLGGPLVDNGSGTLVVNAILESLNNSFASNFAIVDNVAGNTGVWLAEGINAYAGSIKVGGGATLDVIVESNTGAVKGAAPGSAGAVTNTVSNPTNIGQLRETGTTTISNGATLFASAYNTGGGAPNGSLLVDITNLNAGTLISTATIGDPVGGSVGGSGTVNLANGSYFAADSVTNVVLNFADAGGNVIAFGSTNNSAEIMGFQVGDSIEQLPQVAFGVTTDFGETNFSYSTITHVLEITTGTPGTPFLTYTLIPAAGAHGNFQFFNNAAGALVITATPVACFAAGTRIRTVDGDVAVEDLAVGDRVVTARRRRGSADIVWIGHRHIDLRRLANSAVARPVRIRAGAFGNGRPARDLLLSPDHCIFVARSGTLVPARQLVNGTTITVDHDATEVTYYHVELPEHDVLLAEGLPAESYLDTGNRAQFANVAARPTFHPGLAVARRELAACAPLDVAGREGRPGGLAPWTPTVLGLLQEGVYSGATAPSRPPLATNLK